MSKKGVVYSITNNVNGKKYIGLTQNYKNRKRTHEVHLNMGKHHNNYLQNAWNKYGQENFTFEVIEDNIPQNKLSDKEIYYINNVFNTYQGRGYNLTKGGEEISGENNPSFGIRGEDSPNTKYSRNKVLNLYKDYVTSNSTQKELSEKYEIPRGTVGNIVNRTHWATKSLPEICRINYSRNICGENNPWSNLNKQECLEIYYEYRTTEIYQKDLAKKFGVGRRLVERIVNNKHWGTENIPKICEIKKDMGVCGYNSGGSKLTQEECLDIYKEYERVGGTKKDLVNKYPVSYSTILAILNHKHWSTRDLSKEEILGKEW